MAEGFALGVDLGTSNTVAVLRWPDGRTRPLLFDGVPLLPSAVYLNSQGGLHVGRDALRLAALDPARLEPNPKRRIDEATVLLGSQEVSTVDLLAAVLAAVARAAVEAAGFLPPAVLTYPASWGSARRAVLAGAAGKAGWPRRGTSPTYCAGRYRSGRRSRSSTSAPVPSTSPSCATPAPGSSCWAPAESRTSAGSTWTRRWSSTWAGCSPVPPRRPGRPWPAPTAPRCCATGVGSGTTCGAPRRCCPARPWPLYRCPARTRPST